jgi:hypothetical protein
MTELVTKGVLAIRSLIAATAVIGVVLGPSGGLATIAPPRTGTSPALLSTDPGRALAASRSCRSDAGVAAQDDDPDSGDSGDDGDDGDNG